MLRFMFFLLLLIFLNSSASLERHWSPCGRLQGHWLRATGFVQVADTAEVAVRLSVADGVLYCSCKASAANVSEPAVIRLSVPMQNRKTASYSDVQVLLSAACSGNYLKCVSFNDKRSSFVKPLLVYYSSLLSLLPEQSGLSLSSCGRLVNGTVSLQLVRGDINWNTANVLLNLEKLKKYPMCFSNTHFYSLTTYSDLSPPESNLSISLLQEFSLDISSCMARTSFSEGGVVHLAFSAAPLEHHPPPPGRTLYDDIHAAPANNIHSQSRRELPHLRLRRSIDTSLCPGDRHASLRENSPSGTLVTIVPPCSEGGGMATYAFSPPSSLFSVNASGAVTTASLNPNREVMPSYQLTVMVMHTATGASCSCEYTIAVTDENEFSPSLSQAIFKLNLSETTPTGSIILTLPVTDSDTGLNSLFRCSFLHNPDQTFSIITKSSPSSSSGNCSLSLTRPLDYEARPSYRVVLLIRDFGRPMKRSLAVVTVAVIDEVDTAPRFNRSVYTITVPQETPINSTIVTFAAISLEPLPLQQLQYHLVPDTSASIFRVDQVSGELSLISPLPDNSSSQMLHFWVESYPPSRPDLVGVALVVVNTHSAAVLCTIPPAFLAPRYEVSVPEDVPSGTRLAQVEAFNYNRTSSLRYSLAEDLDGSFFVIDVDSGWVGLKAGQMLDHEANHTLSVTVVVMDGELRSSTSLVVQVRDINDNPPRFNIRLNNTFLVPEDASISTPITRLLATDADSSHNSLIRYELLGGPSVRDKFLVTEDGWVLVAGELDRETQEEYQLTVQAIDGGEASLSATTTVSVRLTDVVDDVPVFLRQSYTFFVSAAVPNRTLLGQVVAHTRDQSSNISYCIFPSNASSSGLLRLAVDSSSGEIYTDGEIDPVSHAGRYQFTLRVTHAGMSSTAVVEVVAGNHGPTSISSAHVYLNFYFSLVPPSVCLLLPELLDSQNFSLLDSSPPGSKPYFELDATTGELTVTDLRAGLHMLSISVSSGYEVNLLIHITVLDNATLDNAVGVWFGGVTVERFLGLHLEQFFEFVADVVGVARKEVQLCGVQYFSSSEYSGVELALAVKTQDFLQEFFQVNYLRSLLLSQRGNSPLPYELSSLDCSDDSCPRLQTCRPIYQVELRGTTTPTSPLAVQLQGGSYISSYAFSASHKCTCPVGYSIKDLCWSEVDECETYEPCLSDAECVDQVDDYTCVCPEGVTGKNCSELIPPVTSDTSCGTCDSSHCLYNGSCCATPSGYTCKGCPWGDFLSGPNCELVVAGFEPRSYLVLATPTSSTRLRVSFAFTTVSSVALLLYAGNEGEGLDYVAVEVILGQVKVGVSLGGVATIVTTDSVDRLNDGEWHNVSLDLQDQVLKVAVENCSTSNFTLAGSYSLCEASATLPYPHRTLDLSTPLFVGGLEPPYSTSSLPSSLTALDYCGRIANFTINGGLVDFNAPLRSSGVSLEFTAVRKASRETSTSPWTLQPGSSIMYTVPSGVIGIETLTVNVLARASEVMLVDLGGLASLVLVGGAVVYVEDELSIMVDSSINDGYWHKIQVTSNFNPGLTVSVDDGKFSASIPNVTSSFKTTSLNLHSSSSSSICIMGVFINNLKIEPNVIGVTEVGVVTQGCHSLYNCTSCLCPHLSDCVDEPWERCLCVCQTPTVPLGGQCAANPCDPTPCGRNSECFADMIGERNFSCQCTRFSSGPTCSDGCGLGFYIDDSSCQRCRCDPRGVVGDVCDRETGECSCKSENIYEQNGVGCVPCDCHPVGAVSQQCDKNGQCDCRDNVVGRRCDSCHDGTAALDEMGCRDATVLQGYFTLATKFWIPGSSQEGVALITFLEESVEKEMFQFGLAGLFEAIVLSLRNRSGLVEVRLRLAAYVPRDSSQPLPSKVVLAAAFQKLVSTGSIAHHSVDHASLVITDCGVAREACSRCFTNISLNPHCLATPTCNLGPDTDSDGYHDECDTCPFVFNLDQNASSVCNDEERVCPGGVAGEILWSPTPEGVTDIKLCSFPQLGLASRKCLVSGWTPPSLLGCISVEGRELLYQAQELEEGQQVLIDSDLAREAEDLRAFISKRRENITGGDVQVGGRVIRSLLTQLQGGVALNSSAFTGSSLSGLVEGADLLLASELKEEWQMEVRSASFSSSDFLFTLEELARVASLVGVADDHTGSNIKLKELRTTASRSAVSLELQEAKVSAAVSPTAADISDVIYTLLPTLGLLLPLTADFNTSGLAVATPVLSIQAMDHLGSEVTDAMVTMTLGYTMSPDNLETAKTATCVSWSYQGSGGWSQSGCNVTKVNLMSVTCSCSHLTAFAALLSTTPISPPPPPERVFQPLIFTYVVLCCVAMVMLGAYIFLTWVHGLGDLVTTPTRYLFLSVGMAALLYVVTIDRMEVEVVCGVVGVVLMLVSLCPLSWLLAEVVLIARFLFQPPPRPSFRGYLHTMGWVLPGVLCAISIATVSVITKSFVSLFMYPNKCWLEVGVVWAFVAPVIFLLALYVLAVSFCVVVMCQNDSSSNINKTKMGSAIGASVATVLLYLVTWATGLLALYLTQLLEYLFGAFFVVMTLYLVIVYCFNTQVRTSLKLKLKKKPSSSPHNLDLTFPTTPGQVIQSELKTSLQHPASHAHSQHHGTLTSVPSHTLSEMQRHNTLTSTISNGSPRDYRRHHTLTSVPSNSSSGNFQRQLANLSHQPCYKNKSLSHGGHAPSSSSTDMPHPLTQAAPYLQSMEDVFPPTPKIPPVRNSEDQVWFRDRQTASPDDKPRDVNDESSESSDEGTATPTTGQPPPLPLVHETAVLDCNGDVTPQTPGIMFLVGEPPLHQIKEGDEGDIPGGTEQLDSYAKLSAGPQAAGGEPGEYERLVRKGARWTQRVSTRPGPAMASNEEGQTQVGPTSPVGYLEYTAQDENAVVRQKTEDSPRFTHRGSTVGKDVVDGKAGEETGRCSSYHRDRSGGSAVSRGTARPVSEADVTPLPYETAATSSSILAASCDSLDPSKRPLPPPPPGCDTSLEWWKSPSPSSSSAFSSPPPGMRSRTHSTSPVKAPSSSHLSNPTLSQCPRALDMPPDPVQNWEEFQKLRYKKIQMKSTSEDVGLDAPEASFQPHPTPAHSSNPSARRHHSVATPPSYLSHSQTHMASQFSPIPHTPQSAKLPPQQSAKFPAQQSTKLPPLLANLKKVQSTQEFDDDNLPQLNLNPLYQDTSETRPPTTRGRLRSNNEEIKMATRRPSDKMTSLV